MTTHPIAFTDAMVRAILDGRKTQTRRPIKPSNSTLNGGLVPRGAWDNLDFARARIDDGPSPAGNPGPYLHVPTHDGDTTHRIYSCVQPGDVLQMDQTGRTLYDPETGITWYLKGTLAVESVRAERVQDITEDDARAEGVDTDCPIGYIPAYQAGPHSYVFAQLWDSIYGCKSGLRWDDSPWVWVYGFRRMDP